MKNKCDCTNYEATFNANLDFFLKTYYKFINPKNEINNKSFKKLEESHEILQELLKDLKPKGDECLKHMKSCSFEHSENIEEISSKLNKFEDFQQKINKRFVEILKLIPKENLEEDLKIDKNKNLSDKEIMENDKKSILLMKSILKDEMYKKKKNEEIKDLFKVEQDLNDMLKNIEVGLNQDDEVIDHIENNVIEGYEIVDKGLINLQMAAHDAVSRRRLKYQLGMPAVFCAVGTIVPGIGNIVGALIGGLAGYGLYRIDKYRLDQIDKMK